MRILGVIGRIGTVAWWNLVAFLHFLVLLPWVLVIGPGGRGRGYAFKRHCARVFRVCLQNLGATFIKLGQILSTRPDILPGYVIEELAHLQDRVPPFRFSWVQRTIREDLGREPGEVFGSFEERPIASASVAQVHRAELPDGTPVAVKVRRPRIVRKADFDEAIMVFWARVLSIIPSVNLLAPVETTHEFCRAIRQQLDFRNEAENNARFQANFGGDSEIRFPDLHEELCGEAVLTMEFIEGVKDDEIASLGLDPKRLARIGARAILKMVFEHGFVHADLHPGNILFQADHRVYFIDLGMVGLIDDERRNALAAVILALAQNDGRTVARFLHDGSPRKSVEDYPAYEKDVCRLVNETRQKSMNELEMSLLFGAVFDILRRHNLRADASFTTINIAMLVVEGLGKKLDPELDLFTFVQPYLIQVLSGAPEVFREVAAAAGSAVRN